MRGPHEALQGQSSLSLSRAGTSLDTQKDAGSHPAREAVPGFCLAIFALFYLRVLFQARQCFLEAAE